MKRLGAIIFDIDSNNFLATPKSLPLPHVEDLISNIGSLEEFPFNQEDRNKCLLHPYKSTSNQKREAHKLTRIITEWNTENFHTKVQKVIEETGIDRKIFDIAKEEHVDLVIYKFGKEEQNFYQKLLSSQMYLFFFDKQLSYQAHRALTETFIQTSQTKEESLDSVNSHDIV